MKGFLKPKTSPDIELFGDIWYTRIWEDKYDETEVNKLFAQLVWRIPCHWLKCRIQILSLLTSLGIIASLGSKKNKMCHGYSSQYDNCDLYVEDTEPNLHV